MVLYTTIYVQKKKIWLPMPKDAVPQICLVKGVMAIK